MDKVRFGVVGAGWISQVAFMPGERNILRQLFGNPQLRRAQHDWESVARFVVGAFRADVVRAGAAGEVRALVDELCRISPDFDRIWHDNEVRGPAGGLKRIRHPLFGPVEFEYSSFAVDGRPDLAMVVYAPVAATVGERVRSLIADAIPSVEPALHGNGASA